MPFIFSSNIIIFHFVNNDCIINYFYFLNYYYKGKIRNIVSGIVSDEVIYKSMVLFLCLQNGKFSILNKVLTDWNVIW